MSDNIARTLKDAAVRSAKPRAKPYKLTDGGGLYLLIQPNGAKLWRYKFRLDGKEGLHAIGAYPDISLADARDAHRSARALVAAGVNPVHTRKREREKAEQEQLREQAGTFPAVLQSWRDATEPNLSLGTIKQREREITKRLLPAFKGKAIDAITRQDISSLLKRVEAEAQEVARNLRYYLAAIFEHAIDIGLVSASPVPSSRMLKPRAQESHAAISPDRLPGFLVALDAGRALLQTRTAMWLAILTACRKNEACGARWAEFDLDGAQWTIPAERMKARQAHWVPLSRQAVARLRLLHHETGRGEFLFPHRKKNDRPMAEATLNMMLQRIGYYGETIHGFRSVFSTHFNGQPGVNPDVVERCLAHAPKDKVRSAYNRYQYRDERRAMLQAWADWLDAQRLNVVNKQQHAEAA